MSTTCHEDSNQKHLDSLTVVKASHVVVPIHHCSISYPLPLMIDGALPSSRLTVSTATNASYLANPKLSQAWPFKDMYASSLKLLTLK